MHWFCSGSGAAALSNAITPFKERIDIYALTGRKCPVACCSLQRGNIPEQHSHADEWLNIKSKKYPSVQATSGPYRSGSVQCHLPACNPLHLHCPCTLLLICPISSISHLTARFLSGNGSPHPAKSEAE